MHRCWEQRLGRLEALETVSTMQTVSASVYPRVLSQHLQRGANCEKLQSGWSTSWLVFESSTSGRKAGKHNEIHIRHVDWNIGFNVLYSLCDF
jgi:hypothetical protein